MNPVSPTEMLGVVDVPVAAPLPKSESLNVAELLEHYNRDGFVIVRGMFSQEEVEEIREMALHCNPEKADPKESFVKQIVPMPKGTRAVYAEMKAGDTLFFNGSALHGSGPNRSKDRFRRAFIGHYARGDLLKISHWYLPLVRMDGTDYEVEKHTGGGPCGDGWDGASH